jgi:hypothetical protein
MWKYTFCGGYWDLVGYWTPVYQEDKKIGCVLVGWDVFNKTIDWVSPTTGYDDKYVIDYMLDFGIIY